MFVNNMSIIAFLSVNCFVWTAKVLCLPTAVNPHKTMECGQFGLGGQTLCCTVELSTFIIHDTVVEATSYLNTLVPVIE